MQALQSELIEVVARRALKKRELTLALEKKDAEALKRLGPEYNAMPDKAYFEKKLKDVKDYAEAVAKRNNKKVSPAIEKIFKQTEILFFRYFKDDKASTQITTQTVDPNAPPPAEGGDGKGDGKVPKPRRRKRLFHHQHPDQQTRPIHKHANAADHRFGQSLRKALAAMDCEISLMSAGRVG